MATSYKVLGQAKYDGIGEDTLYTVPASTQTVCSTLSVCNKSGSQETFRVRIRVNGAVADDKQFVVYDAPIGAFDTLLLTFGTTLGAGDIIDVSGSSTEIIFQLFGSELT